MTSKEPVHAKRGWIRWSAAGLLVCAVYASHVLPGPARSQALSAERRWITSAFHVPHWTVPWPPGGAAAPAHQAMSPGAAWTPPVEPARVVQAFGWHHSQFAGNISLQTDPHAQVRAFAPAVVATANQDGVTLKAGNTLIVLTGLTQVAVRGGESVATGELLGYSRGRLVMGVTKDGLPLNPLSREFFGSRWARR